MNKHLIISLLSLLAISFNTSAQVYEDDNGFVGIGTTTPSSEFHVVGYSQFSGIARFHQEAYFNGVAEFQANTYFNNLEIEGSFKSVNSLQLFQSNNKFLSYKVFNSSDIEVSRLEVTDTNDGMLRLYDDGGAIQAKLSADATAPSFVKEQFAVGKTSIPSSLGYTTLFVDGDTWLEGGLEVNGKIKTEQVKVQTMDWPDYVFAADYELPTLQEVQEYIQAHSHLPEVPSAQEVETNGQDLGEMNKLLLKKVEELTLYTISQQQMIKTLSSENENLADRLEKIESILSH